MSDPTRMIRGGPAAVISPTPAEPAKLNKKRRLKAKIRARMERTSESYMVAMHALQNGKPEPKSMTDAEVVAVYGPHLGVTLTDKEP